MRRNASLTHDAVIVLGAAVWQGGVPSPSLRRRAKFGAKLVLDGQACVLIASGGVGKHLPSEADVMQQIALAEGVPREQIILDEASATTLESAVNCSAIMRQNKWSNALIVTDHYHLIRSVIMFKVLGVNAEGRAPDRRGEGTSRSHWYYLHVRELFAIPWSLLRIWRHRDGRRHNPEAH